MYKMLKTNVNGVLIYVIYFYLSHVNKRFAVAISNNNKNQLGSGDYNYKTPNDLAIEQAGNYIKTSPNFGDICQQQSPVCGSDSRTYQNICHLGLVKTKQPSLGLLYKGKCWKKKTTLLDISNFIVKQREKGITKKNRPSSTVRRQLSIDFSAPQQSQTPKPLLTSFFSSPAEADHSLAVLSRQKQDLKNELEMEKIFLLEEEKKALLEEQRNITKEILNGFDKRLDELRASIKDNDKLHTEKRAQAFINKTNSHEHYETKSKQPSSEKEELRLMKTEIENYKKNLARLQVEVEFHKLQKQKHIEQLKKELARQRAERKELFKQLREALEKPRHHHKTKADEEMLRHKSEKEKEKEKENGQEEEKRKERNRQELRKDLEKKTAEFEKELKDLHALYKKNLLLKSELEKQSAIKKSQYETLKLQLLKNIENPNKDIVHNINKTTTNFWF